MDSAQNYRKCSSLRNSISQATDDKSQSVGLKINNLCLCLASKTSYCKQTLLCKCLNGKMC